MSPRSPKISRMSPRDLELTLDGVPIQYPALVKEAFLNNWHASVHRTEVTSNCASLNEKYCWVLSRNQMFIWEIVKASSHRASIPIQLPLPTSGLPRSVKCVVVYDGVHRGANESQLPGVLVVSPEGVLRHWTSIESQNFVEKVLDINSEVALRVELVDEPESGKSASFLLTTTSGTVYFLSGDSNESGKNGSLSIQKVISRETHGFRRRLSSIMFGGQSKDASSLVTNSFTFQSKDLLVVAVSPDILTVYSMTVPCELWSLKTKDYFQEKVSGFFESEMKKPPIMVRVKLMDAAAHHGGLMVLLGGSHDESKTIHIFVMWFGPKWQYEVPTDPSWSSRIPMVEHRALFSKHDDSIYSNMSLCIPKTTSEAKEAERNDGIIIVNPFFALSLYVPFNLERPKKTDLSFYKCVSLPPRDQLIGSAVCEQYVYLMLLESGISTVRLLPRGFTDGSILYEQQVVAPSIGAGQEDWAVLSELLSEMVASGLPKSPVLQGLHKAFELFGEKNISKAAKALEPLIKMADQEMTRNVEKFMFAIIDYSDAANKTETELHAKRVLTSRMLLFLNHMGLFERILTTPIQESRNGVFQLSTGGSMLAEMSERVSASTAVWAWRNTNETNTAIFDAVIEKVLGIPEVQELGLKDKDALFGRCGMVHHIPIIAAKQLEAAVLNKARSHKYEVFHAICDLLINIKDAIIAWRRCRTKLSIQRIIGWWTKETFISCYRDVAEKIIAELREGTASDSERTRMMLYILGIYDFYLGECEVQPDNDKVLQELINLGKIADAMELAEKHRDFGTLIKNYLPSDRNARQKTFDRYKKMFERYDFEMYLCQYLKKHGRNDVLLEQEGGRVDAYLDNFKELRYSREIGSQQFGKAALTLMSLAESETKSFAKFSEYLTRAFYCASTTPIGDEVDVLEVFDYYKRRLPELKHRKRIPVEVFNSGYGGDQDVMMSIDEMLEWNMTLQPNDETTINGFVRAFHLLGDLVEVHPPSAELKSMVDNAWKSLIDHSEWNKIHSKDDVEKKTMFGKVCNYLVNTYPSLPGNPFPDWMPIKRLLILPSDIGTIVDDAVANTTGNHASWIKGHVKWVGDQLSKKSRLPKETFFHPDKQNVGSISLAVLEGFAPILERRQKRFLAQLEGPTEQ